MGLTDTADPAPPADREWDCPFNACSCTLTSRTNAASPSPVSRTTIGVGEKVRITSDKPVTWKVTGQGTLLASTSTTVDVQATAIAGAISVFATAAHGACLRVFTVVAPEAFAQVVWSSIRHFSGHPTCGFKARTYLLPGTVSFEFIQAREQDDMATSATGYYSTWATRWHRGGVSSAGPTPAINVGPPMLATDPGSPLATLDEVWSGDPHYNDGVGPSAGNITFPARLEYTLDGSTWFPIKANTQTFDVSADGTCKAFKAGAHASAPLTSSDQGYDSASPGAF